MLKRSQSTFQLCTRAVQVLFQFPAAVRVTAIVLVEDRKRLLRNVYLFESNVPPGPRLPVLGERIRVPRVLIVRGERVSYHQRGC
jgi:hypothetical protein